MAITLCPPREHEVDPHRDLVEEMILAIAERQVVAGPGDWASIITLVHFTDEHALEHLSHGRRAGEHVVYFDDATRAWYAGPWSDLRYLRVLLGSSDKATRRDAYSLWCSATGPHHEFRSAEEAEEWATTSTAPGSGTEAGFLVQQRFETIGDPCQSTHGTRSEAEVAATNLRRTIASTVAEWPTPEDNASRTGLTDEVAAWQEAERLAGVVFDETGQRTDASPRTWGQTAAEFIAYQAVVVDEEER